VAVAHLFDIVGSLHIWVSLSQLFIIVLLYFCFLYQLVFYLLCCNSRQNGVLGRHSSSSCGECRYQVSYLVLYMYVNHFLQPSGILYHLSVLICHLFELLVVAALLLIGRFDES
jgi:hypothetical protein